MTRPAGRRRADLDPAEVRAAYEAGLTLRQCAQKFGVPSNRVSSVIRVAGGTIRPAGWPRGSQPGPAQATQIRAAYQAGMTVRQAAAQAGIAYGTTWKILHGAGVLRPRGQAPAGSTPAPAVVGLYDGPALSVREVAALFNVGPKTVRRWRATGRMPAEIMTPGGQRGWPEADILALLRGTAAWCQTPDGGR